MRLLYGRIKAILESAALDVEKLPPPKSIWFEEKELEEWYESRKELQKRRWDEERERQETTESPRVINNA